MSTAATSIDMRLDAKSAGLMMSPDEFDAVADYDDSVNYELIKGVLVVTPMASNSELAPNQLLGFWLLTYGQNHPEGKCLVDTMFEQYLRTRGNRRRADRVVWVASAGIRPNPKTAIPTIVVEFVSGGKAAWRRDYVEKRDEYLEAGVLEYWVIDRFRRTLTVFSRRAGEVTERTVNERDSYCSPLLPGFELRLAELLVAADRWSDDDDSQTAN